jgi:DNA-binding HxlR family transcriptional regulator
MKQNDDYYLRAVVTILSSKWALPVLYGLKDGTKRYHEINNVVPDMTQKVLTDMLRRLERHGFIERVAHPTVPPKVEYNLTELGVSFLSTLAPVLEWAKAHLHEVNNAQNLYDAKSLAD